MMARYAAFDFAGLGMARRKDNSFTNETWRAAAVVRPFDGRRMCCVAAVARVYGGRRTFFSGL
ncbi:MAG: hypothetical protein ACFNT8_02685 [Prevotella sp.]